MKDEKNMFGCFVSSGSAHFEDSQEIKDIAIKKGEVFRDYIWGEEGICDALKKLNCEDYGGDLKLVLFQFYVNPIPYLLQALKEIEPYRKNEKSIGMPIVVNDENFFNQTEMGRYKFLKTSILKKMDLLADVIKQKKLDTQIEQLKFDVEKVLR